MNVQWMKERKISANVFLKEKNDKEINSEFVITINKIVNQTF